MGCVELLTSEDSIIDQLLIIERAGRTCYNSYKNRDIDEESSKEFIAKLIKWGHESVIEHSILSILFKGFSRGFTHQIVRHRLCAFSQRSTRYVLEDGFNFVRPSLLNNLGSGVDSLDVDITGGECMNLTLDDIEDFYRSVYKSLIKHGVKKDSARQYLPIGTESEIVVSTNFREWRHIFNMRLDHGAHWEIRDAMQQALGLVVDICSPVFDDFKHLITS